MNMFKGERKMPDGIKDRCLALVFTTGERSQCDKEAKGYVCGTAFCRDHEINLTHDMIPVACVTLELA